MSVLPDELSGLFPEAERFWKLPVLYTELSQCCDVPLSDRDKIYLRGILCGYGAAEIAKILNASRETIHVSPGTIRVSYFNRRLFPGLRALLEKHNIETATHRNFAKVLPKLLRQAGFQLETPTSYSEMRSPDWDGVPDKLSAFYGRGSELDNLQRSVNDSGRVFTVHGQHGIGKTRLVNTLVHQIGHLFHRVVWRSLKHTPPLSALLTDLLETITGQHQAVEAISLHSQFVQLSRHLSSQCHLLVLDDADTMLEDASDIRRYRPEFEDYGSLFKMLGESSHCSCILLTAWEVPPELDTLEQENSGVRSLRLKGLALDDAKHLLVEYQLTGEDRWHDLIQLYRGSPFALKVVAAHIQEVFEGDVDEFWSEDTIYLGEMINLLHVAFKRLSSLEYDVVRHLSDHVGQPMTRPMLQQALTTAASRSLVNQAIQSLKRRSLIEQTKRNDDIDYSLPPIVLKYIQSR
ncbi:MAG: AAA family ATPase [Elainellaceae cyanobacterium]